MIENPHSLYMAIKVVVDERLCAVKISEGDDSFSLKMKYKSVHDLEDEGPPKANRRSESDDDSDDSRSAEVPADGNISDLGDEEEYVDEEEYDESYESEESMYEPADWSRLLL